ncbi:MAG: helicase [Helicobacter sp.]|nr:helicase [Helicobacter sp.]MDY5740038.1 helicase [Helicobacter sp.]
MPRRSSKKPALSHSTPKSRVTKDIPSAKTIITSTESKREFAKLGMSASLITCVGSAFFMKNKTAKNLHILSGIALVGFSIWHSSLYDKKLK